MNEDRCKIGWEEIHHGGYRTDLYISRHLPYWESTVLKPRGDFHISVTPAVTLSWTPFTNGFRNRMSAEFVNYVLSRYQQATWISVPWRFGCLLLNNQCTKSNTLLSKLSCTGEKLSIWNPWNRFREKTMQYTAIDIKILLNTAEAM